MQPIIFRANSSLILTTKLRLPNYALGYWAAGPRLKRIAWQRRLHRPHEDPIIQFLILALLLPMRLRAKSGMRAQTARNRIAGGKREAGRPWVANKQRV